MHAVGAHFFHQFHTVVDDEGNIHDLAPFLHLVGDGAHFIIRGILHAELNPSAESCYRLVDAIQVSHLLILVRDELQLKTV